MNKRDQFLNGIKEKSNECSTLLEDAESALEKGDIDYYRNEIKRCLVKSEQFYLELRSLAANEITDIQEQERLDASEMETSNIVVEKVDNDIIKITMPIILPFHYTKKILLFPEGYDDDFILKKIQRSDCMITLLERKISEYLSLHPEDYSRYWKYTLCFLNGFDSSFCKEQIPDTDNYSYKYITDLIASYFCNGDNFLQMGMFIASGFGSETHTEILIIPQQFYFDIATGEIKKKSNGKNQKPSIPKVKIPA